MKPPPSQLLVKHRKTLEGQSGEQIVGLVECPKHAGVVELGRCFNCGHGAGLAASSDGQEQRLGCDVGIPEAATLSVAPPADGVPDVLRVSVAQIMQRNVVCLSEDVPIARATAALIEGGFSGAPVVDLESRPIGIISLTDLVRQQHAADNEQPSSSHRSKVVGDWMTPIVCSIPESSDIGRAAAVMAFEGIHRVPVTSNERRVVGIVSALDIMRALAHAAGFVVPKGPAPRQPKSDSQQR